MPRRGAVLSKPFAIVKMGCTLPSLLSEHGDFDKWFARLMDVDATVYDMPEGAELPNADSLGAVLVTGSSAMVTARAAWSERTARWLPSIVAAEVPLLAVCYGHQLLAHGLDGAVGINPRGRQIGTLEVNTTAVAHDDELFAALPRVLVMQATHVESVLTMPTGSVHLARSDRDTNHAFRVGRRAWAVQFHPEMNADVIRTYVRARSDALRDEGLDPEAIVNTIRESTHGQMLLSRFARLAGY